MSFATGGYIFAKRWPFGIDDLELIDGIYQKKPVKEFKMVDETMWGKMMLEAIENINSKIDLV